MKLPILGDLQSKSAISRFTRTMGTLVTSGVPILQALTITRDTAGNVVVAKAIESVHDGVKEGEAMVTPLASMWYLSRNGDQYGGRWRRDRSAARDDA